MKIAFIVQRYGLDVLGGAEFHCRLIAELLSKHYEVEILTTCAKDYLTWKNDYEEGDEKINGLVVKRFKVAKERKPKNFGRFSRRVFKLFHFNRDELKWLELQGPYSPSLFNFLERNEESYDLFIFFSYRFWPTYHGIMRFSHKSFLVPTAEHDDAIYLKIFKPFFNKPKAIIYNSVEEKNLINHVSSNNDIFSDIIGVGVKVPERYNSREFRNRYNIFDDYVIYVGRIDPNKGCPEMFQCFLQYVKKNPSRKIKLVLIGKEVIKIPRHKSIIYLGSISSEDKFSAINNSLFMIMPSQYESLSMVTLEAWFVSKPVLVNGRCEVLKGQCRRSNGGLYYSNYEEFEACMDYMLQNGSSVKMLGKQGNAYAEKNYKWEVIERKYINMIKSFQENNMT